MLDATGVVKRLAEQDAGRRRGNRAARTHGEEARRAHGARQREEEIGDYFGGGGASGGELGTGRT